MTDNVVDFPARINARSCFTCAYYTPNHCGLFDEQIDSELFAAKDCDGYEDQP